MVRLGSTKGISMRSPELKRNSGLAFIISGHFLENSDKFRPVKEAKHDTTALLCRARYLRRRHNLDLRIAALPRPPLGDKFCGRDVDKISYL